MKSLHRFLLAAMLGSFVGGAIVFVAYWTAFLLSDAVKRFAAAADVDEASLFMFVLMAGAFIGAVCGVFWLNRRRRTQLRRVRQKRSAVAASGHIWLSPPNGPEPPAV